MKQILSKNKIYNYHEYRTEDEFEKKIVEQSDYIFGEESIYLDIKKRVGKSVLSIPDGYLIDFTISNKPVLYLIENELSSHSTFGHIAPQVLRFAQSYMQSKRKLQDILKESINRNTNHKKRINKAIQSSEFLNIDEYLDYLIHDIKLPSIIVIIDDVPQELEEALSLVTLNTNILSFKTYKNKTDEVHLFEPYNSEVRYMPNKRKEKNNTNDIDTIVVPARKDGFDDVFIKENCWYAIKMSSSMIEQIKYIAAYQVSPISAVTHYAEIERIEKYDSHNKHDSDKQTFAGLMC